MKYKVGDKVRIKSKEWYEENRNTYGDVDNDSAVFNSSMAKYCGKEATIICIKTDEYYIDIDGRTWKWVDWMFDNKPTISTDLIKDIAEVVRTHNLGVSISENEGKLVIEPLKVEEDLPVDTPCMVSANKVEWYLRYYAGNQWCYSNGDKSKSFHHLMSLQYIIPFDKFNPNEIEESLKHNIVKQ